VGGDRDQPHDAVDIVVAEAVRPERLRGLGADQPLRARAGVHLLGRHLLDLDGDPGDVLVALGDDR
jgi:hypothetical protein